MLDHAKPRRSVLYMPGSKARALEKAKTLPADALILDLEDAVSPAEKANARALIAETLRDAPYGPREVLIRINGLDTDWAMDDIAMVAASSADGILIPKVNSAADVATVRAALGAAKTLPIWAMIETPLAIINAAEIAFAEGMAGFVLGTNDLIKDLNAEPLPGRANISAALQQSLHAARAAGILCIDGVWNAIKDVDGLREECLQGRAFGFDGKTLIHPAQLETANAVFAPDADALHQARAIIAAFEDAAARSEGVAVLDGRIVENLHAEMAKRLVARAEAIAALEGAA